MFEKASRMIIKILNIVYFVFIFLGTNRCKSELRKNKKKLNYKKDINEPNLVFNFQKKYLYIQI